jgi:DNA repair photolyase
VFGAFMGSVAKNPLRGRGTASNIPGRFALNVVEPDEEHDLSISPRTEVRREKAKSLITRNQSPDVPFNLSVNPYRGCEHGCIYCFARPSHAYLDLSPGIDFETKLSAKMNAAEVFRKELSHPNYRCEPIALGINTDAYQPIEKELNITRQLLEVAYEFKQPISLVTKSSLIMRDLDLLQAMAAERLVHTAISLTTFNNELKKNLEPRAASGAVRLKIIRTLRERGIPVIVLAAPVIPFVNDSELETIVQLSAQAGAQNIHYIMLRLPYEVAPLFTEWLNIHMPERAERVLSHMRVMHGGKVYRGQFGQRMTGTGAFADLIRQRFHLAKRRAGFCGQEISQLDPSRFQVPPHRGEQIALF